MGSCLSSSGVTYQSSTAKVVTVNGALLEYSSSTMVSEVLETNHGIDHAFICSSDELHFDKHIPALVHHHWLELDQIYFILPMSMLQQPLLAKDMASLAVKASLALAGSSKDSNKSSWGSNRTVQVIPVREYDEQIVNATIRSTYISHKIKKNYGKRTPLKGRFSISRLSTIEE